MPEPNPTPSDELPITLEPTDDEEIVLADSVSDEEALTWIDDLFG
ncbi:hypothetical protein [Candidatus Cyanaurora vandensis]|nr:hypothetical protein [Candidatus Cyanaurora vandensis]